MPTLPEPSSLPATWRLPPQVCKRLILFRRTSPDIACLSPAVRYRSTTPFSLALLAFHHYHTRPRWLFCCTIFTTSFVCGLFRACADSFMPGPRKPHPHWYYRDGRRFCPFPTKTLWVVTSVTTRTSRDYARIPELTELYHCVRAT